MKYFLFALSCLLSSQVFAADKVDMILYNGVIWTGDTQQDKAQAIALAGNKIAAVGNNESIRKLASSETQLIDLKGRLVTPGFIDNHTHFYELSALQSAVQLRGITEQSEFNQRIKTYAQGLASGEWILDGVWDHQAWGGTLPQASWVDDFTQDKPLYLLRTDGHMAFVNSRAMEIAGVDKNTMDVPGGEIVRDSEGNPTGIFKDEAMALISKHIPRPTLTQHKATFIKGVDHALSLGVTQIHDMATWADLEAFQSLKEEGKLKFRVYSFVPLWTHNKLKDFVEANGRGDDRHRWGGLKAMVDGALGSTTAWFYEPYVNEPDNYGFPIYDLEQFRTWITAGDLAGLNVTIHAIGDRANDWLLEQFKEVTKLNPDNPQRRWRIEHAQHLSSKAITRFADLGVIPSMQPYHAIDDGRWAEKKIGPDRIRQTYAFKSLLDAGAKLTFGSDAPVAPINVMQGIYAAVTRSTLDGANPEGWVPEQKISLTQALQAYTVNNAYAGLQEDRLGKLQPGYLADLVVLERDLFAIDPEMIKDVGVVMTIVDGKIVYQQ